MVGYFTQEPNSQSMPTGMPQFSVGDFLGIVGNRYSDKLGKNLIKIGQEAELDLPLKSIQIPLGLEEKLEGLGQTRRSDHYPFWKRELPAVMLTDTAEFRNKNYHRKSDTPDTLNYPAMLEVVKLLEEFVKGI